MKSIVLQVEGMSCSHCEQSVTKAVSALDGIASVVVSLREKTVTVQYDEEKASPAAMARAIDDQGYDVVSPI